MTTRKFGIAAALLTLTAILLLSACANANTESPLRLHIKANSNSEEDQQIKLAVRDAVLEVTRTGITQCKNADEAEEYIEKNLQIIVATANDTLAQSGFDYTACAEVGRSHFPEKSYCGTVYPEGEYEALRITLGEGEGENWWCVMFPPLCIYEAQDAKDAEYTSLIAQIWEMVFGS